MSKRKGTKIWRDERGVSVIAYALVAAVMALGATSVIVPADTLASNTVASITK